MYRRYSDPENIIHKKLGETIKAYDNWEECETLEKLESIRYNQNAIHMESLSIRERILGFYYIYNFGNRIINNCRKYFDSFFLFVILGQHNPLVPHHIIFRGAVFADNARFDKCIDLWLHALYLKQLNNMSVVKDFLRFAQVFKYLWSYYKNV